MTRTLVARLDNLGDVLLAGPAVRAAAVDGPVVFVAGPRGADAAALLPGVEGVLVFDAPWIGDDAPPTDPGALDSFVRTVAERRVDRALVLTSFHQSPLPLALLLRLAGVPRIGATSVDHPGSLLDHRQPYDEACHEVEQHLAVAAGMGCALPPGDDGSLRVRQPRGRSAGRVPPFPGPYVVVHPGASVPARGVPAPLAAQVVDGLVAGGVGVVVTGGPGERALARAIAGERPRPQVADVAGALDLPALAAVLAGADAVVCGNTGPAHLAAAVGTPVVQVFAPVVPAARWRPWGVPAVQLGALGIGCAGCRARTCPIEGQPCTAAITAGDVLAALEPFLTGAAVAS